MANNIQTIMRTAAMIYADEQSASTAKTVKRHFVDAAMTNNNNIPETIENIVTILQKEYELVILETELQSLLDDDNRYEVIVGSSKKENKYYLPNKRYQKLKEKSENTIDCSIREFISTNTDIDSKKLQDLLYKYLFSLLNTNISAYSQLLVKKGEKASPVIDSSSFEEDEIELINKFIQWKNPQKDRALYELVNYCIDYASAINSIDPRDVVSALENKKLYLDNALIYRALGINGEYRKQRVLNLLERCVSSGQQLLISSITRQEFFETIDYHLKHLKASAPYGQINPKLFRQYTGGNTIYQYYHEWKRTRNTYGFDLFLLHIKTEYEAFLKKFKIEEDFKQQYNDVRDINKIESYADEIFQFKRKKIKNLHINDAKNMVWIEMARKECDHTIRDTKYYFVTSDRRLQEWDLQHSKNQPITMLPSQWLALLLKYVSHSNDDFKSFVSFLAMPVEKELVSADELQNILAGISEITEDLQKQSDIVSNLLELHKDDKDINRESAKNFAKEQIEAEYEKKIKEIELNNQVKAEKQKAESNQLMEAHIAKLKMEFQKEKKQDNLRIIEEKIKNCQSQLNAKQIILKQINSDCDKAKNKLIAIAIILIVLGIIALIALIHHYGWDFMEPITFIGSIVFALIVFVISIILNKKFEFRKIPLAYREKCFRKQCQKYAVNESEICDLNETIKNLNQQKNNLENDI